MAETTTIQVKKSTKEALEKMKIYKRETYNEVLERLLEEVQELNEETKKKSNLPEKLLRKAGT